MPSELPVAAAPCPRANSPRAAARPEPACAKRLTAVIFVDAVCHFDLAADFLTSGFSRLDEPGPLLDEAAARPAGSPRLVPSSAALKAARIAKISKVKGTKPEELAAQKKAFYASMTDQPVIDPFQGHDYTAEVAAVQED